MSRPRFLAALAATLFVLVAPTISSAEKPPDADSRRGADEAAIEKALAEKTVFDFTETPLSVVVEKLSKRHGIPIVIDRKTIQADKGDPDPQVTKHLSGISLRSGLDLMLREYDLTWTIRDNAVLITTRDTAEKVFSTRVYPVEDLVSGRDEAGLPADGSKTLTDLAKEILSLDDSGKVDGTSVRVMATKDGRCLPVTHNRWGQERVADLLGAMRSAIQRGKSPPPSTAAEKKIKAALHEATSLGFIEMPLDDVVRYLGKCHKIEIQIDRRALGEVGIDKDTPVTRSVSGISLQSALSPILRDLGLTCVIRDEVLLITTSEKTDFMLVERAYDVADLVTSRDNAGRVRYEYDGLMDAIMSYLYSRETGCIYTGYPWYVRKFSNGTRQLIVLNAPDEEADAIGDLLAAVRRLAGRTAAGSSPAAIQGERGSQHPKPMELMLPGEEAVQKALAQKSSFEFDKTPLADVVDYLKDLLKIEIQLDTRALRQVRDDVTNPVTIKASGITLRDALKKMLTPNELTWIIRDEVLLITTQEEADGFLVTKVYAIDGLPDSGLPVVTGRTKELASRSVISSDAVRAMVVTATYADQEQIAAKLAAAREARLSIMLGGDAETIESLKPCWATLGKTFVRQGGPGAGQHAKLVNQILISAVMQSVESGAAGSWSLSNLGTRIIADNFAPGFFVEHFVKDLGFALSEARRMNLCLPGLALAEMSNVDWRKRPAAEPPVL